MGDYTNPPPTIPVGGEVTSTFLNEISGNTPYRLDFPTFQVVSTLVATDVLQGACVIPANGMGLNRRLRLWLQGILYRNTSNATEAAPEWSVNFGVTPLVGSGHSPVWGKSTAQGFFDLLVEIKQLNAVNAQLCTLKGIWADGTDTNDFTTGKGFYEKYTKGGNVGGWQQTAVDLSPGGTLAVTVKLPVSSGSCYATLISGEMQIL